jgi:hypothetical protein
MPVAPTSTPELQEFRLTEARGTDATAAGVVHVHQRPSVVSEPDDFPDLLEREQLVRDGQPGEHDQRDLGNVRQRLFEGGQPTAVHEARAHVSGGPHDGRMAVAGRDPHDDVAALHHGQVRRQRSGGHAVEQGGVVAVGNAAEMLQGHPPEPLEIERRSDLVVGDRQLFGGQGQPPLQAREVVDGVGTTRLHDPVDDLPGVLQLAEVVLRRAEDLPACVRQAGCMRITEAIRAHRDLLSMHASRRLVESTRRPAASGATDGRCRGTPAGWRNRLSSTSSGGTPLSPVAVSTTPQAREAAPHG